MPITLFWLKDKPKRIRCWAVLTYFLGQSEILFFRKEPDSSSEYFHSSEAGNCFGRMDLNQFNQLYQSELPATLDEARNSVWLLDPDSEERDQTEGIQTRAKQVELEWYANEKNQLVYFENDIG